MLIAFAGDWHGNHAWGAHVIGVAKQRGADHIVHVGDLGYQFTARFLTEIESALRRNRIDLWFVDGNHDNFDRLATFDTFDEGRRRLTAHLWHLPRGHRWQWDGVAFLACGGAYSIDRKWRTPGRSWWPQETITDEDVAACAAAGHADVLVSHDCPHGVDIPGLDAAGIDMPALYASELHRQQIGRVAYAARPRLVVHGHYHRRYTTAADLGGYGPVTVVGLGCDGEDVDDNLWLADTAGMARR